MERVWLALGSNMSDPLRQINTALYTLNNLPKTHLVACSSFYRSRPLGPTNQPDFLNTVAALDTALIPEIFLDHIQAIELYQGRTRKICCRWGPRSLDLDILLFGERSISTTQLIVPHYDMQNREFVLYPLAELAPNLRVPNGRTLSDCLKQVPYNGLTYWE